MSSTDNTTTLRLGGDQTDTTTTAPAEESVETPTVEQVEEIVHPHLTMEIAGRTTKLLSTQYAPEEGFEDEWDPNKRYWSFREPTRKSGAFGTSVKPLADTLPNHLVIDGVRVSLEKGTTKGEYKDRKSGSTVTKDERPLVAFNGLQVFPTVGKITNVLVTITVTEHKQWWIKVIVSIPESPEEKAKRLQRRAEKKAGKATDALFD